MDLYTLSWIFDLQQYLPAIVYVCILLFSLCFFQLYLHTNPDTRNVCSHTCILNLHVYQKSSVSFSLWDIQQYRKHYTLAVFLPTYGYDQDSIRLQWSLLLFDHIIILISSQCQPVFFHKSLSYDTLEQTLYDTYNSTLCVLNCYCLSLDSPPLL